MHIQKVLLILKRYTERLYHSLRTFGAEQYRNPDELELASIEAALADAGIICENYNITQGTFEEFQRTLCFPPDYHGGAKGGVYEEKLLEHYVAWDLLSLHKRGKRYLDIAGASSPWANLLCRLGVDAYSVDLKVPEQFSRFNNYRQEDATATQFPANYFDGASAQCAYEMFEGDSDIRLLAEIHRILKPGSRLVITPLYMHTHACYYQTPEFWGKPHGDAGTKAYIRRDCWGVPASRKYCAQTLQDRVFKNAQEIGFRPMLSVLRNKEEIPGNIYLHFILVLEKPHLLPTSKSTQTRPGEPL